MALNLNDENFEKEVMQSQMPVLVDFWADWCPPCKMIAPTIDELTKELEGKLKVCKLNVDEAKNVASDFGIMSIPTLMIFKGGEEVEKIIGAISKEELISKIKPHIE